MTFDDYERRVNMSDDIIERMRHRDTDGDGVNDFIDSNGYSKPNDKYIYREVSYKELDRLRKEKFDLKDNLRQSQAKTDTYIVRFPPNQEETFNRIIRQKQPSLTAMTKS